MSATAVTARQHQRHAPRRRVRKAVTNKGGLNGTTRFVWGGDGDWQCLEERDGSDNLVARFTYSPGYIDAVAVQERDLNADSDFGDTNEVVYYQANTLFSIYALSDLTGSVVERYRYDAYGGCTVLDADGSADADGLSDVKNPYTFTARRLDQETGLMQYRWRCYCPAIGRFIGPDLRRPLAWNLFVFVGSKPCLLADPLGLAPNIPPDVTWWFLGRIPAETAFSHIENDPHMPYPKKCKALAYMRTIQFELWLEVKMYRTVRLGQTWTWADVRPMIQGDPQMKDVLDAIKTCEGVEYGSLFYGYSSKMRLRRWLTENPSGSISTATSWEGSISLRCSKVSRAMPRRPSCTRVRMRVTTSTGCTSAVVSLVVWKTSIWPGYGRNGFA